MSGGSPPSTEQARILAEFARRDREVAGELYAPWNAAQQLALAERRLLAAQLLQRAGVFPQPGDACLELGCGRLGWLADLLGWGLTSADLHAIELDPQRAAWVQQALPGVEVMVGDAARLPWPAASFRLVIASTVFTSVLDPALRQQIAAEIVRVLTPGGAFLFYDFKVQNPRNPNVRKIRRRELRALFPELTGEVRSLTLAPPLARQLAPLSRPLAGVLAALPFLRTHLLAVLIRPGKS